MSQENGGLVSLVAMCWKNDELKARFVRDPIPVLAAHGMPVDDGMDVKVVDRIRRSIGVGPPSITVHIRFLRPDYPEAGSSESDAGRPPLWRLFDGYWRDDAFKDRFMVDPESMLREHGLPVAEGMSMQVTENIRQSIGAATPSMTVQFCFTRP